MGIPGFATPSGWRSKVSRGSCGMADETPPITLEQILKEYEEERRRKQR